jgi:hypothetical protein
VSSLTEAQYALLVALVDRYVADGNRDPGLAAIRHEDRGRLAMRYPDLLRAYLPAKDAD